MIKELDFNDGKDLALFRSVLAESFRLDYDAWGTRLLPEDIPELSDKDLEEEFGGARFFVALKDEDVIALLGVEERVELGWSPDGVYMRNFYIRSSERGRGLAEDLLRRAAMVAQDLGKYDIYASFFTTQERAAAFYNKHGFKEVERGDSSFKPGRKWITMRLEF
jgi:GNAT superfamily N-acetyltransferase